MLAQELAATLGDCSTIYMQPPSTPKGPIRYTPPPPPPNLVKMGKSWFLDPRRKTLEHFVQLALVIVAIILTGVYLNMGIRITRSEIMIIPIVRLTPIDTPGNHFQTARTLMRRQLRRESNP